MKVKLKLCLRLYLVRDIRKKRSESKNSQVWTMFIFGVLVSLTFWVPHIDSFNVSKFTLLGLGVLVMSVLAFKNQMKFTKLALSDFILISFIILLAINLVASPNFYQTLIGAHGRNNGFLTYFSFAILAFIISHQFKSSDLPKLLYSLFFLGIAQTTYNILQLADLDLVTWNNPYGSILGTLGNSDFAAALLAICATATLWLALLKKKSVITFTFMATVVVIEVIVMIESQVRQSLVLFLFGLSTVVYYEISKHGRKLSIVWISLVSTSGFFSLLGTLQIGPLTQLLYKESITYRGDYWRAAWRMFVNNPIFGVGLGNYGDYFNRYRDEIQASRRGSSLVSDVAHSIPLDFFAMGGIFVGTSYLFLIFFSNYLLIQKFRKSLGEEKIPALIIFSLLNCYLLQSFISIDQIGLAVWGWIFFGIAFSFQNRENSVNKNILNPQRLVLAFSAIITAVAVVFVSIPTWNADTKIKVLASLPRDSSNTEVSVYRLKLASELISSIPRDSHYKTQAALYLLSNGQAEGIDFAKKAIQQNPSDSTAYRYLVIAYTQLNDVANLARIKAAALLIDPFNPDFK